MLADATTPEQVGVPCSLWKGAHTGAGEEYEEEGEEEAKH